MKSSRIPEDVNKYRPGPCTEIKSIGGHYYVYMYNAVRLPSVSFRLLNIKLP